MMIKKDDNRNNYNSKNDGDDDDDITVIIIAINITSIIILICICSLKENIHRRYLRIKVYQTSLFLLRKTELNYDNSNNDETRRQTSTKRCIDKAKQKEPKWENCEKESDIDMYS